MEKKKALPLVAALAALLLAGCDAGANADSSSSSEIDVPSLESSSEATSEASSEPSSDVPSSEASSEASSSEESSSSSSVEEFPKSKLTFSEALTHLNGAISEESNHAIKETNKEIEENRRSSTIVYEENLTLDIHEGQFAEGHGTLVRSENGTAEEAIDIDRVTAKITDKVRDPSSGDVADFDFLYHVVDYGRELNSNYADDSSRLFVVGSASEAAGLDESGYILSSQVNQAITFQHAAYLYQTVSGFTSDPYIVQTGVTTFELVTHEGNIATYSTEISYSYEGDLDDTIVNAYELSFTFDFDSGRLISYEYTSSSTDTANYDPTDVSVTKVTRSGTIEYGTKLAKPSDAIDPHDYFLSSIESYELVNSNGDAVDPNAVPLSTSFLFLDPTGILPSTAIGIDRWSLTPVSSSNEAVASVSSTAFEVVGSGLATLSWSYFGRDADGVYESRTIAIDIAVLSNDSITFIFINDLMVNKEIAIGSTLTLDVLISPSTATPVFGVKSSDESVAKVTADVPNGTLTIEGVGAGTATITAYDLSDENIYGTTTVTVYKPVSAEDILAFLTGNEFYYESPYSAGLSWTYTFEDDGSGVMKEEYAPSTGGGYMSRYPFSYTLDGYELTIVDGSYGADLEGSEYPEYYTWVSGEIASDLSAITMHPADDDLNAPQSPTFTPTPRS